MSETSYSYQQSSTDGDLLPVVDEHDQVIGSAPRRKVHAEKLRHRSVHAVVINGQGEVLLQKRSMKKDSHPGCWDISMGGHVDAGETYEVAAARELVEELGVPSPAREVARREAGPDSGWEFVRIYEVIFDGDPTFNRDEIDAVKWVTVEELFSRYVPMSKDVDFCITGSGMISLKKWAEATDRL